MICACTLNKYNTTLANSNPSRYHVVCMQSLLPFCLLLLHGLFFLSFPFKSTSCLGVLKAPCVFYVFKITDSYGIQLLITDYVWWVKDLWRDITCKKAWPSSVRKAIGLDTEISLFSVFRPPRSPKTVAVPKHWRFYICVGVYVTSPAEEAVWQQHQFDLLCSHHYAGDPEFPKCTLSSTVYISPHRRF